MSLLDENHDDYLENLMDETVRHLVSGYVNAAADGMATIAQYFARAGMPIQAFQNMRKHLIDSATQEADCPIFIGEKLKDVEKILYEKRTGTTPSTIITH